MEEDNFNKMVANTLIVNGMISAATALGLLLTGFAILKYEDSQVNVRRVNNLRSVK